MLSPEAVLRSRPTAIFQRIALKHYENNHTWIYSIRRIHSSIIIYLSSKYGIGWYHSNRLQKQKQETRLQHVPETSLQLSRLLKSNIIHLRRLLQLPPVPARQFNLHILHSRKLSVLVPRVLIESNGHDRGENLQRNANTHSGLIFWLILVTVRVGGPDTSGVTDSVDKTICGGTLSGRTRNGVSDPGEESSELGEDEDHEEKRGIAGAEGCRFHVEDVAHDGDGDGVDEEPEAVVEAVGEVGVGQGVKDHEDIGRCDQHERNYLVVVELFSETGEVVLEATRTDDAVEGDGQYVGLDVAQCIPETLKLALTAAIVDIDFGCVHC